MRNAAACSRVPATPIVIVALVAAMAGRGVIAAEPPVDPSRIEPGHGVVFGSIEVQWPDQPKLIKLGNSSEKIVEIHRLDKVQEGRTSVPAVVVRPRVGGNELFVRDLVAGRYVVTCLYHKDVITSRPTGYCYPVGVDFLVESGKVTYVGRVVLRLPKKMMSLQMDVAVQDDRAAAEAALADRFGTALSTAGTRLAVAAAASEGVQLVAEEFPRLHEAMQAKDRAHTDSREHEGYQLTRFVIEGRSVDDWDIALEVLETYRLNEPPTARDWLQKYRAFSDPSCPGDWQVLAESDESVLFERTSPECPPHAAQQALHRTIYGRTGVWSLICTQKGALDEATRRECRALLESATIQSR